MAAKAAARAIEQAGIAPEEIDLILLATSSPDSCFPNGACEVQAKIGAIHAACYDISAACTGFVFASVQPTPLFPPEYTGLPL